ncbi:hypothetical protein MtrunA17_Chr6g0478981 [Medicago truncatula]|uniref:Transmembrane protein n=1 Tax=Medicago truncatula TaxID=3880 RepID=A0A396HGD0_MEDTR|nr:hypothetical protein MtrunA17_Chr6g0478981 [Medicago truncatula]
MVSEIGGYKTTCLYRWLMLSCLTSTGVGHYFNNQVYGFKWSCMVHINYKDYDSNPGDYMY